MSRIFPWHWTDHLLMLAFFALATALVLAPFPCAVLILEGPVRYARSPLSWGAAALLGGIYGPVWCRTVYWWAELLFDIVGAGIDRARRRHATWAWRFKVAYIRRPQSKHSRFRRFHRG